MLLFLVLLTKGQNYFPINYHKLSPKEQLQDIAVLKDALLNYHPGRFYYNAKNEASKILEEIERSTLDSLPEYKFYLKLMPAVKSMHCGHTDLYFSKKFAKTSKLNTKYILPFTIYNSPGGYRILNNILKDSSFKVGDRIISINNKPIETITQEIGSTYTSDGYTNTLQPFYSNYYFQSGYWFINRNKDSSTEYAAKASAVWMVS